MSAKALKAKASALPIGAKTNHAILRKMLIDGFFDKAVSSEEVVLGIRESVGDRWKTSHVQTYMKKFMREGIIHAVKPPHSNLNFWVIASVSRPDALKMIGKTQNVKTIEEELFSPRLMAKLKKNFSDELLELRDNFGRNGNCTAFLLRKILEKLIIIVLSKRQKEHLLEDAGRPGGRKGLKEMIEIAAREKVDGVSFLIPKTANEIKGLKFLGDAAAHNPLTSVDMTSILPQMPYMITAYEELSKRL
jgi:hypothetical protein